MCYNRLDEQWEHEVIRAIDIALNSPQRSGGEVLLPESDASALYTLHISLEYFASASDVALIDWRGAMIVSSPDYIRATNKVKNL